MPNSVPRSRKRLTCDAVQRTYDFVLQPAETGQPLDPHAVIEGLRARGASLGEDGSGTWKVGRAEVTLALLKENGQPHGYDVRLPFLDDTGPLEEVLTQLVELAETLALRIGDPQRGELASLAALSSIIDEYLRMAKYAGEYGGVSEALGLSSYASEPDDAGGTFRWLAILVVLAVALYAGFRFFTVTNAAPDEDDELPEVYRR